MKKSIRVISLTVCLIAPFTLGAQKEKSGTKLSKKEKLDRTQRPKPGPAPEIKMEEVKSFTLSNGLKVFVVENHKLPKVSFSLSFDVKPVTEGEKCGTAVMAGQMLGTATQNLTKDEINKRVDFIGASLNTSEGGVSGSCLVKHSTELLTLMNDVLINAKFEQTELDKLKNQTLSGLSTTPSDPNSMMANLESSVFFGKDHPYGEVVKSEHVEGITLEDCRGYYETYVRPNISYLTIVGDVTLDQAKEWAETYFGKWQRAEVVQTAPPPVAGPKEVIVAMIDKPGAPQSVVQLGYPVDYKIGSMDDAKVKIMNEILGGNASARLFRNIREKYNFSYGAYSTMRSDEFIGKFLCSGDIRAGATDSAIHEFLNELNRLRSEAVTQEELDAARNNLAGKFSIMLERPSTVGQYALYIEKYKLPADYYRNYLKRLEAVTIEDVRQTAARYLNTSQLYILVVGDREKLENRLKKFATSGKILFYDAFGDPAVSLKKAPDGVTATTVLDTYINAIGGKKVLSKVKDESIDMEMEIMGQKAQILSRKKTGGMLLTTTTMGTMVLDKQVCDGTTAKRTGMMGAKDSYSSEELAEVKRDAEFFPEMKYLEWGYTITLLGIDVIDGRDAYKLQLVIPGKESEKHFEYYDVKSGLKLRSESMQSTPQGDMLILMDYQQYKPVNNIQYPHSMVLNQGGQVMKMKVNKIELNKKLKKTVFKVE